MHLTHHMCHSKATRTLASARKVASHCLHGRSPGIRRYLLLLLHTARGRDSGVYQLASRTATRLKSKPRYECTSTVFATPGGWINHWCMPSCSKSESFRQHSARRQRMLLASSSSSLHHQCHFFIPAVSMSGSDGVRFGALVRIKG